MTDSLEGLSEEEKNRLGSIAAQYSDERLEEMADIAREVIARILENGAGHPNLDEEIYAVGGYITDSREADDTYEIVKATVKQAAVWVRAGELG